MKRLTLLCVCILACVFAIAKTIVVKNIAELNAANNSAKPGDIVILENGRWNDVTIALSCSGTKEKPIRFKARTAGEVLITGRSKLKLGGNYIIVEGLHFTDGYAGDDAVIDFRINKDKLANNCRVTNCLVEDFNNPKRMDENNWVLFHGKKNRLDHCTFVNKLNMGVLLAVVLEDDRSRENFHSIDHNHFGRRQPLASNGGEIIRVGVSQHCQFNSYTVISDNYFEYCDGETEIISIKSGSNTVRGNLFLQSQGSVVLRHGDNNTVENNIFLGLSKEGSGGVRVINRGQWVVNNFFYQCRGLDFRSPLAIMNGVPNSPAHRYVQVTDAVIANNTFYECAPITFGEGSDKERSVAPDKVFMANNIIYNTYDSIVYKVYDDISGFRFWNNHVSKQVAMKGFNTGNLWLQKAGDLALPVTRNKVKGLLPDSLQKEAQRRLGHKLSANIGFQNKKLITALQTNAQLATGVSFCDRFQRLSPKLPAPVYCRTAADIYKALASKEHKEIILEGDQYDLSMPFIISKDVKFVGREGAIIRFNTGPMQSAFILTGNGRLTLEDLQADGTGVRAMNFIASDSSGPSAHFNLVINNSSFQNFGRSKGCENFFYAFRSTVGDSISIRNSSFTNNDIHYVMMNQEKDDKGYYNAEKIVLHNNRFTNCTGVLMNIYRGGNDESTLGPQLFVTGNTFSNMNSQNGSALIHLTGVQKTRITGNAFTNCNPNGKLMIYKDIVRADHLLQGNSITGSGEISK